MNNPWILAVITGVGFSWPLIARLSNISPIMTSLTLLGGTILTVLISLPFFKTGNITTQPILWCIVAGVVNGIGFIAYAVIISKPQWAPVYIPISLVIMVIIITLGGVIFFKDPISLQKGAGIILGAFSIWLLTK